MRSLPTAARTLLATFALAVAPLAALQLAAGPADAIVGGYQVADGEYAFMASIQIEGQSGHRRPLLRRLGDLGAGGC